jgi:glutaredoxin
MRIIIRLFFKTLRIVLGPFMLAWEFVSRPKGLARTAQAQNRVDQQCQGLVLYQFSTCPFCIKVRQEMRRLSLPIARLDAQHKQTNRDDLLQGGGVIKVPCLKITEADGQTRWLYESGAIISYLNTRFAVQ